MSEKEPSKQPLWYVKSTAKVEGPFPSGGIRRSLLLGRFTPEHQISEDQVTWQAISEVPEVMPPELRQAAPGGATELLRARLREDQRSGRERRVNSAGRTPGDDRRRAEPALVEKHREAKTALRQISQERAVPFAGIGVVGLLLLLTIGYGLYLGGPQTLPDPICSSPPAAGVDWHNCRSDNLIADTADLEGANLSNAWFRYSKLSGARLNSADIRYTDLSNADLSHAELRAADMKGSALRNTDLSYADLTGVDLRYADLTGANLGGSVLTGARLDHAIWPDGRKCPEGSLGNCPERR